MSALLVLSLCILILPRFLFQRRHIQNIPGPFLAKYTNLWLAYHAYRGRRYLAVHNAHQRYGTFVRIAPNHVSVASPHAISIIYAQGQNAAPKSTFYDAFVCQGKPSIFSTRDRMDHAAKRRLVSHAFSSSALSEFIPLIRETIGVFRERMDDFCSSQGQFFDALPWFNYLAFDILSDLAFGERIGMLAKGSDVVTIQRPDGTFVGESAISLVDEREHFAAILGLVHPLLQTMASRMPFLAGQKATSGLEELARQHVLKRLQSRTRRDDILGKLILARGYDQREPGEEEVRELTAEAVTLLIAGSDTTSNSLAVILHLICTHPRVHEKLLRLLLEACDEYSYERVKDVPYLQATINEALRLHSITAIGLHRSAPPGGLVVEGRYFEEGTELSVPAWTTNHDAEIWSDPESFRPERWLEDGNLKQYLLAFGKGPRACIEKIGQNLAFIELTSVVSMMLLRYKIEARDSRLETTEGFMHKPVRFSVRLQFREKREGFEN